MSTETPRTDAEHAKTLTPAYEYEGAEHEAWEFARKLEIQLAMVETLLEDTNKLVLGHVAENMRLEKELAKSVVLELEDWTPERWNDICTIQRPEALWISGEQMDRLMNQPKEPLPFSELF